jgi:hypothetical protein
MEDLKQTIGNLTILGANDNQTIGNDDFLKKRPILAQSSAVLTQELAQKTQWSRNEILTRTAELKEMATKIFKVK